MNCLELDKQQLKKELGLSLQAKVSIQLIVIIIIIHRKCRRALTS